MTSKTDVVVTCFDHDEVHRKMTQTCLRAVRKFTDDYTLILVDPQPCKPLNIPYGVIEPDKHIKLDNDPGVYACMNKGAEAGNSEYICFLQNDVFVTEGWLDNMIAFIEKGLADIVYPDQIARPREYIRHAHEITPEEECKECANGLGWRDAGCMLIKRDTFNRVGKWNEDYKMAFGEREFIVRSGNAGCKYVCTCKSTVHHLRGVTAESLPEKFAEAKSKEAALIQKYEREAKSNS